MELELTKWNWPHAWWCPWSRVKIVGNSVYQSGETTSGHYEQVSQWLDVICTVTGSMYHQSYVKTNLSVPDIWAPVGRNARHRLLNVIRLSTRTTICLLLFITFVYIYKYFTNVSCRPAFNLLLCILWWTWHVEAIFSVNELLYFKYMKGINIWLHYKQIAGIDHKSNTMKWLCTYKYKHNI